MRFLAPAGLLLALTASAGQAQAPPKESVDAVSERPKVSADFAFERPKVSVDFAFELENIVRGDPEALAQFPRDVAGDLSAALNERVGFLDFVPGARFDQPYHLHVALRAGKQGSESGAGFSHIEFDLWGGPVKGDLGSLKQNFVDPEELSKLTERYEIQNRIRDEFMEKLPDYQNDLVETVLSKIPIREQATVGYWAMKKRGFIPLPQFHSDLRSRGDTTFRMFTEGDLFNESVEIEMKALKFELIERQRETLVTNLREQTLDGYPAGYWDGKEDHSPIVCQFVFPAELEELATESSTTGSLSAARIHVKEYKFYDWPMETKVPQ